jgi:hypothetical protein
VQSVGNVARRLNWCSDEDRGDGRAGKRTERWRRAKGKLGEEGPSLLTRHTRAGRRQARKFFGIERAVSCGSPEPGRWGTELDLGSSPSLVVSVFRWAHPFADPTALAVRPREVAKRIIAFSPWLTGRLLVGVTVVIVYYDHLRLNAEATKDSG